MIKIALLTWYQNENYGSSLQAYALQNYLMKYGDCKIVDYRTKPIPAKISMFWEKKTRKRYWGKLVDKGLLLLIPDVKRRLDANNRLYLDFIRDSLCFTNVFTEETLPMCNEDFDYFVCGSDQIWNPTRLDSRFLLEFTDDNKTRIAYAPSIGVSSLNGFAEKSIIEKNILRFHHISVRETDAQNVIENITGVTPTLCVDPTLLVDSNMWKDMVKIDSDRKEKYLLCYFLTPQKRYWKYVRRIACELGLIIKVVPYNVKDYLNKYSIREAIGTKKFLEYIANAEFICTDSFHGSIFSMIYEKPFVVMQRFSEKNKYSQNSRILSLLDMTKQSFRFEPPVDRMQELYVLDSTTIEEQLNLHRKQSRKFLDRAFAYGE